MDRIIIGQAFLMSAPCGDVVKVFVSANYTALF
jgi:hypothetical protein